MMMRLFNLVAAFKTTSEPVKLIETDSIGFSKIVFTPSAAAMCKTRSAGAINFSTSAASRISPWWISIWSLMWSMLASDPVDMLSRIET